MLDIQPLFHIIHCMKSEHREALETFYKSRGVGDTVEQRQACWDTFNGVSSVSKEVSAETKLALCEQSWLIEQFPADFDFC